MVKKNADEMQFWTKEEFAAFIEAVMDKPASVCNLYDAILYRHERRQAIGINACGY